MNVAQVGGISGKALKMHFNPKMLTSMGSMRESFVCISLQDSHVTELVISEFDSDRELVDRLNRSRRASGSTLAICLTSYLHIDKIKPHLKKAIPYFSGDNFSFNRDVRGSVRVNCGRQTANRRKTRLQRTRKNNAIITPNGGTRGDAGAATSAKAGVAEVAARDLSLPRQHNRFICMATKRRSLTRQSLNTPSHVYVQTAMLKPETQSRTDRRAPSARRRPPRRRAPFIMQSRFSGLRATITEAVHFVSNIDVKKMAGSLAAGRR
ncbi:hypothetical protein EVAR_38369_1 [Eumeta japonica]|uniref:Uncharacterized protein n=1 Tax=Eumeta variegata TaxID=151549 RepID=A0A4C1XVG2_EUMVA|nr:hypothetical protein EVAR_38369_1 [Eumeta japonica]